MEVKAEKTEACARWLSDLLGAGTQRVADLVDLAEEEGFSKSILYRARETLEVREFNLDGKKYWQLDVSALKGGRP